MHLDTFVECWCTKLLAPSFAKFDRSQHREEEENGDQGISEPGILEANIFSEANDPESNCEGHELSSQGEQQNDFSSLGTARYETLVDIELNACHSLEAYNSRWHTKGRAR